MDENNNNEAEIDFPTPPGTLYIGNGTTKEIVHQPTPSADPNDPLNWSRARKYVNFTLTCLVTVVIFTQLSIQSLFWQYMIPELNVNYDQLNNSGAIGYVGMVFGCVVFIPFALKYGRRPVYLVSTLIMAANAFWTAKMSSVAELYITNLLGGLAGATNETIVQMTVADLFFVHEHGSMNGIYLVMVSLGSFLVPVASGAQAAEDGWRWCYWTLAIVNSIVFLIFVFFFEETKYQTVVIDGEVGDLQETSPLERTGSAESTSKVPGTSADMSGSPSSNGSPSYNGINHSIPMRSWWERMRLVTKTDESMTELFWRPMQILFTFPAVTYTALQYGFCLCWVSAIGSIISIKLPYPPYNFGPTALGLTNLGPFIGTLIGSAYIGLLGDWSIILFARRNKGFYEPEMRLYLLPLPVVAMAVGLLMTGITTDKTLPWIVPVVGSSIFGFGFGGVSDAALTLAQDSYPEILGEAFIGIAFVRNVVSIAVLFALGPWMAAQGLQNVSIVFFVFSLVIGLLFIPMIMYGKRWRTKLAPKYAQLSATKGAHRT